jgi:NADPH oxidase
MYSLLPCSTSSLLSTFRYYQATNTRLDALNALTYSVWISRGAGLVLTFDGTLILLPMCRNIIKTIRPRLRWLPLDETVWFHRQVSYALLIFTILHVAAHYVK